MEFLKGARKEAGLSQEKLADLMGVHLNTIWGWENSNKRGPNPQQLTKLCEILHTTEAELLHGPKSEQVKITLVWDRKDVEGEINMNGNGFSLFLGDDGTVGIKGAAKFTSREALKEAAQAILKELEQGYDFQIQRGLIKAEG